MVRSSAPKRLWDNCLEREAYVRSLTAHDIYRLDGQVPETLVSGETADISPFVTFKWYEWVLFRDTSVTYPDDTMVLGRRDLGPAIDIGPATLDSNRHRTCYDPKDPKGEWQGRLSLDRSMTDS